MHDFNEQQKMQAPELCQQSTSFLKCAVLVWVWKGCDRIFSAAAAAAAGAAGVYSEEREGFVWTIQSGAFFFFFVRQISSHPGALVHSPPTLYPRHAGRSYLSLLVSAACCADWGSVSPKLNCHVISSTPALPLRPGLSVRQQDGHANYPPLRTHLFPLTPKAVLSGNVSDGSWYKTGSKGWNGGSESKVFVAPRAHRQTNTHINTHKVPAGASCPGRKIPGEPFLLPLLLLIL